MRKGDWEAFKSFFLDGDAIGDVKILEKASKVLIQLKNVLGINYNEERLKELESKEDVKFQDSYLILGYSMLKKEIVDDLRDLRLKQFYSRALNDLIEKWEERE